MATKKPKDANKRKRRQNDTTADWESVSPELIQKLICTVAFDGGAVRFGYSRDGGAFSIGIYGDGKPFSEFHPPTEGVTEWLEGIIYDYA